ncbi:hypothetical protein JRQ81_017827 [Phrynocephalus forsythii]|uniref:Cytochrome b5 heme-binding domain-containing protein n=1 Tax=Phrynocephalus forsythii TaxID=171643 RepID=A0A9Q1B0Q5_9SAUR|nr:hypothetical protein JRQ81_017827 [Phrynocephalus forsythii]
MDPPAPAHIQQILIFSSLGGGLLPVAINSYRSRYYTLCEVSVHNRPWDFWVSFLGRVYDLSPLAVANQGDILMKPILEDAANDTWKNEGVNLDMDKNLHQNHIPDEDEEFYQLSMDVDAYTPAILVYFNDDLMEL